MIWSSTVNEYYLPVKSQLHHINDDFILFSVLPRQNDRQLPEQRAPENHIGIELQNLGGAEGRVERELILDHLGWCSSGCPG